jgi:hypothetical protein
MKTLLGLAVLAGGLATGASVSATPTNDTVTGSQTGVVRSMGTINATYSEVFVTDSQGNYLSCNGGDTRWYISRAHARHQLMYDTLLAAKLSARSIEIHAEDVTGTCWVKRVILQ